MAPDMVKVIVILGPVRNEVFLVLKVIRNFIFAYFKPILRHRNVKGSIEMSLRWSHFQEHRWNNEAGQYILSSNIRFWYSVYKVPHVVEPRLEKVVQEGSHWWGNISTLCGLNKFNHQAITCWKGKSERRPVFGWSSCQCHVVKGFLRSERSSNDLEHW